MIIFVDKNNVVFEVATQEALDALYFAEGMYVVAMDIGGGR